MLKYIIFIILCLFIFTGVAEAGEKCHIVYGLFDKYQPYEWFDESGIAMGMNIDLLNAVANHAGCSFEIVSYEWKEMLQKMEKGEITMMSVSPTPYIDTFSIYLAHSIVMYRYILSRADGAYVAGVDDLRNKKILVIEGSFSHSVLENMSSKYDFTTLPYPNHYMAIKQLSRGTGDIFISTMTAAMNVISDNQEFSNIKGSPLSILPSIYGFALNKKDTELFKILDVAMEDMKKSGEYFEIVKRWSMNGKREMAWIRYTLTALGVLAIISLFILAWNKSLYMQVRKKTAHLDQEIKTRIKTEEENVILRDEALIQARLAALGEMATSVAHEINNPAGLIGHNMDFIEKATNGLFDAIPAKEGEFLKISGMELTALKEEVKDSEKIISESLLRIRNTINELKEYGNARNNTYQRIDVLKCVETSIRMLGFFIKKYTAHFSTNFEAGDFLSYGNPTHIEQVVLNLIQNSCFALTSREEKIICSVNKSKCGKFIIITISDEGRGMTEEVKQNACKAFYTTRKGSGGTGLGLSIALRIIKEHKGTLTINSVPEKGTSVIVTLPVINCEKDISL